MIVLLIALWLIIGAAAFIFWTITERDVTVSDISMMILISLFGPIAIFMGLVVYSDNLDQIVIFKKKI